MECISNIERLVRAYKRTCADVVLLFDEEPRTTNFPDLLTLVDTDLALLAQFELADSLRSDQTCHGLAHANLVRELALALALGINEVAPERISLYQICILIHVASYLHDIGSGRDHALSGAQFAWKYLFNAGFPEHTVREICGIIACHRSSAVLGIPKMMPNFLDAAWMLVAAADKFSDGRKRVREQPAAQIAALVEAGKMSEFSGDQHDQANYAIVEADFRVESTTGDSAVDGVVVLMYNLDSRVATPNLITTLFFKRFQTCIKAFGYLHFGFCIEFNSVRYVLDQSGLQWVMNSSDAAGGAAAAGADAMSE